MIANPVVQIAGSLLLTLFCIVFLPKALDIAILIAIVALMLFKVF